MKWVSHVILRQHDVFPFIYRSSLAPFIVSPHQLLLSPVDPENLQVQWNSPSHFLPQSRILLQLVHEPARQRICNTKHIFSVENNNFV